MLVLAADQRFGDVYNVLLPDLGEIFDLVIRRECRRKDTYSYDVVRLVFQGDFLLPLVSELNLAIVLHLVDASLLVFFLTSQILLL